MYRLLVLFLILIFCLMGGCGEESSSHIYFSEPLGKANDSTLQTVGEFYYKHFRPGGLKNSYFRAGKTAFREATGLEWYATSLNNLCVDFNLIFNDANDEPIEYNLAYITELIYAKGPKEVLLSLASDDGFWVWVNGDSITSNHADGVLTAHTNLIPISLEKGANIFLYKIDQLRGRWGWYREFRKINEANALRRAAGVYRDLPRAAILPDTAQYLPLKSYKVEDLSLPLPSVSVSFSWSGLIYQDYYRFTSTYTHNLPEWVPLPDSFQGRALLLIEVSDPATDRILYREEIPIFTRSEALRMAKELTDTRRDSVNGGPILAARRDAVEEMFHLKNSAHQTYSTRMKAHALADLYRYVHDPDSFYRYPGPQNWGYESESDGMIQPFRIFVPHSLAPKVSNGVTKNSLPIVFHLTYGTGINFWGEWVQSHYHMALRAEAATNGQLLAVNPFGRGSLHHFRGLAKKDIPHIMRQLRKWFQIDTSRIALLGRSDNASHALSLLSVSDNLPFTHIGLIGPTLVSFSDQSHLRESIERIRRVFPDLKWFVWHGKDDAKFPVQNAIKLIEMIKDVGFQDVNYEERFCSNHETFLFYPMKEFYSLVGGTRVGEVRRTVEMKKILPELN